MHKTVFAKPGYNKHVDYEYRRNGVVDLFMIFEPWKHADMILLLEKIVQNAFGNW